MAFAGNFFLGGGGVLVCFVLVFKTEFFCLALAILDLTL